MLYHLIENSHMIGIINTKLRSFFLMGKIVLLELYAGQHFGLNYAKERAVADAPIYI